MAEFKWPVTSGGGGGGSGTVTSITAGSGLTGGVITTSGTIAVDTGITAGKIVALNGGAQLPAVSGVNLTALNASNLASGTVGTARLGSGTASGTKFLAGDSTWKGGDAAVSGNVIDFSASTQYVTISSNTTFTYSNAANGLTTTIAVSNSSGSSVTLTFPAGAKVRTDFTNTVAAGVTNLYTIAQINSVVYIAAIADMV